MIYWSIKEWICNISSSLESLALLHSIIHIIVNYLCFIMWLFWEVGVFAWDKTKQAMNGIKGKPARKRGNKNLNSIFVLENPNKPQHMNHIWIDNLANFLVGKLSKLMKVTGTGIQFNRTKLKWKNKTLHWATLWIKYSPSVLPGKSDIFQCKVVW